METVLTSMRLPGLSLSLPSPASPPFPGMPASQELLPQEPKGISAPPSLHLLHHLRFVCACLHSIKQPPGLKTFACFGGWSCPSHCQEHAACHYPHLLQEGGAISARRCLLLHTWDTCSSHGREAGPCFTPPRPRRRRKDTCMHFCQ